MKNSEALIQSSILDYLNLSGHICIRVNAGKIQTARGNWVNLAPKGAPDIMGCSRDGRAIGIEVKTRAGKLREGQAQFLEEIRSRGGVAGVCRSIEDVQALGL